MSRTSLTTPDNVSASSRAKPELSVDDVAPDPMLERISRLARASFDADSDPPS